MHTCPECGKSMATGGGLEIHMELSHAQAPEPAAAPATAVGVLEEMGPAPVAGRVEVEVAAPERVSRVVVPSTSPATERRPPAVFRRMDPTVPLTALLVVALFLGGIVAALHRSSSGGSVTTAAPAPAPAAVDPAADQRLAQSMVLDQNDFPDGWTTKPHSSDPADIQQSRDDNACVGLPDPATTSTAKATGPDGRRGQGVEAGSEVIVVRSEQQARAALAAMGGPQAESCLKRSATEGFSGDGVNLNNVAVGRLAPSTGNVRNVAFHIEVTATKGAARVVFDADLVFLQQGRVIGLASFVSFGGPFPPDVEQTLVSHFAHKLANA